MKINDKEYKLELTGYTLVLYKQEFHKDLFSAMSDMNNNIDVVSLMEIIWAFIKCNDKTVPSFDEFSKSIKNIKDILSKETIEELTETIRKTTERTVESKNV